MNYSLRALFTAVSITSVVMFASGCTVKAHGGGRAAPNQPASGGRVLGERVVHGGADHDAIEVAGNERFRRVEIFVDGSALEMFDVVITFGNGERYSPPTRLVFDNRTSSRVIDLPGGDRDIRRIDFRYGNLPGGGRARVLVRGS